jgi:hypothetical protein
MHGVTGFVTAVIITPLLHKIWFPKIMVDKDGAFKNKKKVEEELERIRNC